MLIRLNPFFNSDDGSEGGWGDLAQSIDTSADDGQPDAEPDAQELDADTLDTDEPADDEVEPDGEDKPDPNDTPTVDDETAIELGEGRQPVKLAELKQGYLRQSDYTKKTQELATQRKEVDSQREELAPIKGMNDFLVSNPWLSQQINGFIKEFQETGSISLDEVLADAHYGQYVNHLMAENHKLNAELTGLRGEFEGVKLTGEMTTLRNDLKAEYGELVTDEYMNTLQERGKAEKLSTATLKEIADGNLSKQKLKAAITDKGVITKEAEAKTIQQLQEQRRSNTPAPKSTGQRPGAVADHEDGSSWLSVAKSSM
jgi:hypothetical protein